MAVKDRVVDWLRHKKNSDLFKINPSAIQPLGVVSFSPEARTKWP